MIVREKETLGSEFTREKSASFPENPPDELLDSYFAEVRRTPLLTPEQEIKIFKAIENARESLAKLNQNKNLPPEEVENLKRKISLGKRMRERAIKANGRLVISVAKRYRGLGVSFIDLIQEGNIGLMTAIDKFNYHKGWKLSTYATFWIRQSVRRAVAGQSRTIRVPIHQLELLGKLKKEEQGFLQDQDRKPTVEELASILEKPVEKISQLLKVSQRPVSLETPVGEEKDAGGGSLLNQFVEDKSTPPPPDLVADSLLHQQIEECLSSLTPREARILRLRYGLKDGETHTLEEVGQKFGLTRERIRQLEVKALRKLRHPSRSRKLRDFY